MTHNMYNDTYIQGILYTIDAMHKGLNTKGDYVQELYTREA